MRMLAVAGCLIIGCHSVDTVDPILDAADDSAPAERDASAEIAEFDPFTASLTFDDEAVARINPATLGLAQAPCRAAVLARVSYAVDGDTITVAHVDSARTETIRIIGVDTPEVAHNGTQSDECFGPEARTFTRQLVGHVVWLTFDGLCTDPYDRTLAYVHYAEGGAGLWERQILQRGLGRVLILGRNRALENTARADQQIAMSAGRGLWGVCH